MQGMSTIWLPGGIFRSHASSNGTIIFQCLTMLMKQNSYFSRYLRSFSTFCSIVKMDMGCYTSTHEHMREDIRIVLRERVHTGYFCHCIWER